MLYSITQTFLDPKVTCDRIIEVIGNFEQVFQFLINIFNLSHW